MTPISENTKEIQNSLATHPLQSYEWGEFRKKTGVTVQRYLIDSAQQSVQRTLHAIPHTPWSVGYFPKGTLPTKEMLSVISQSNTQNRTIFTQMEPNIVSHVYKNTQGALAEPLLHLTEHQTQTLTALHLKPATRPLFTKYTFVLDLTPSEEDLLKNMHAKTRYNIRVAQKHSVEVKEDNSPVAFEKYLSLTNQTTKRQRFFAHSMQYHTLQWETLSHTRSADRPNELTSHLFLATYQGAVLAAWILFIFKDTLYYPYGASSSEHREVMASNLMMWDVIRFGKKHMLKKFDMWGSLGPNPDPSDAWYGFHRFKLGYGADLHETLGSFDIVSNNTLYRGYKVADKLRWLILKRRA